MPALAVRAAPPQEPESPLSRRHARSCGRGSPCGRRRSPADRALGAQVGQQRRAPVRLAARQQGEQRGHRVAQLAAGHDQVDVAVAQVGLGQAEVVGGRLARRLLDHPRPGEREQGARLGDRHVAQRGKAGRDAARGRVRHHRDVAAAAPRAARPPPPRSSPSASAPGRPPACARRPRRRPRPAASAGRRDSSAARAELLADHRAHAAAQEGEVHHRQRDGQPPIVALPTSIASSQARSPARPRPAARGTASSRRTRAGRPSSGRARPRSTSRRPSAGRSARARVTGKW